MGLLTVTGAIHLNEFWPQGQSDGDTCGVFLNLTQNPFKFKPNPGAAAKTTHVFDTAKVKGKAVITATTGRLKVRFQAIDAPELHYTLSNLPAGLTTAQKAAIKAINREFRQFFGETAADKLRALLAQTGKQVIPCTVTTAVDSPGEVFDMFGRFIGDIHVKIGGKGINLNQWMVEQGWAFPTFYSSMSATEINTFLTATQKGAQQINRIWKHLQKSIGVLNQTLIFRGTGVTPNPAQDIGPVLMPKLFRRLVDWTVLNKAGVSADSFHTFLGKKKDDCFLTKDFLLQGATAAPIHFLDEFVQPNGKITIKPQDLVFREKPSTLVDANGKIITSF